MRSKLFNISISLENLTDMDIVFLHKRIYCKSPSAVNWTSYGMPLGHGTKDRSWAETNDFNYLNNPFKKSRQYLLPCILRCQLRLSLIWTERLYLRTIFSRKVSKNMSSHGSGKFKASPCCRFFNWCWNHSCSDINWYRCFDGGASQVTIPLSSSI